MRIIRSSLVKRGASDNVSLSKCERVDDNHKRELRPGDRRTKKKH